MIKRSILLLFMAGSVASSAEAQNQPEYRLPPQEIYELADFERVPTVSMNSDRSKMLMLYRSTYKSLSDLSAREVKLGGLRIDPVTNISSTVTYQNNVKYKGLYDREPTQVEGLPDGARLSNFSWSPDETKVAFTNTTAEGVELWYFDFSDGIARKVTGDNLNANLGSPFSWFRDSRSFLVREIPADRPALVDTEHAVPTGPTVSVSEEGVQAQNRTYQNLLQNSTDEHNFDALVTSEVYKVGLDGTRTAILPKDIYTRISFSPDGEYLLVTRLRKPYSYIVPYNRFPTVTDVFDKEGELVAHINEKPLIEALPKGFMATQKGMRSIGWRNDKPATLYWVEALDGGDPEVGVPFRDELFELPAPFDGSPRSLAKMIDRLAGVTWGDDRTAIVYDRWQNTRNQRTYLIDPSDNTVEPAVLNERNYQDIYTDPGQFDTKKNIYGQYVLNLDGRKAYLVGDGYSPEGKFPFVDEVDLGTLRTRRIYRSDYTDRLVSINSILDAKKGEYLIRMESATEYPNYYVVNTRKRTAPVAVTHFENPFQGLDAVHKEVIYYTREDGVELSGTLYLPAGYDMENRERLPLIMWAYPHEYKDNSSAGQTTASPHEFTAPSYGSPIYWVTRGYAILDKAAFPIVGEGDKEPNDTFVEQLVANAKAAIDALDGLGYIDPQRVAVGGHSYGAFMTANLLTHSDLFAAGIARSGAYNRTLTPFGFQSEERNYWDVPEVYNEMSPFMHADKMKTPLLLIHGENDDNSGAYPMQSERYFNALKGFGAPARLVILPRESHGYAARESIMHMLWEQDQWLEKYVKNRK